MKKTLAVTASVALLGMGTPAATASPSAVEDTGTVTIRSVGPLVSYVRTQAPTPDNGYSQLDGGTVRVGYRCTAPEGPTDLALDVTVDSPTMTAMSYRMYGRCDGTRRSVHLELSRRVDMPFDPPHRWERATVTVAYGLDREPFETRTVRRPVLVAYSGW